MPAYQQIHHIDLGISSIRRCPTGEAGKIGRVPIDPVFVIDFTVAEFDWRAGRGLPDQLSNRTQRTESAHDRFAPRLVVIGKCLAPGRLRIEHPLRLPAAGRSRSWEHTFPNRSTSRSRSSLHRLTSRDRAHPPRLRRGFIRGASNRCAFAVESIMSDVRY